MAFQPAVAPFGRRNGEAAGGAAPQVDHAAERLDVRFPQVEPQIMRSPILKN